MMGWGLIWIVASIPWVENLIQIDSLRFHWNGSVLQETLWIRSIRNVNIRIQGAIYTNPPSRQGEWSFSSPSTKTLQLSQTSQPVVMTMTHVGSVDSSETLRVSVMMWIESLDPVGPDTGAFAVISKHFLIFGDSLHDLESFPDSVQGRLFTVKEVKSGVSSTAYGYVKVLYSNRDFTPPFVEPLKGLRIRVCKFKQQFCLSYYTNAEGIVEIPLQLYNETDDGRYWFWIQVEARNSAAHLADFVVGYDTLSPRDMLIYHVGPPEWGKVLETMRKIREFSGQFFGYMPEPEKAISVVVRHDPDCWPSFNHLFGYEDILLCEVPDKGWTVWDRPDSMRFKGSHIMAHEYGHWWMYDIFGGWLPSGEGPDPHRGCSVSSPGFAMKEGWAAFFGYAYVRTTHGVPYLRGSVRPEPYYGYYKDGRYYPARLGCDLDNTDGTIVEGAVMQVFWDIWDDESTPDQDWWYFDDEGYGRQISLMDRGRKIKDVFSTTTITGIVDFLEGWQAMFPDDDIMKMSQITLYGFSFERPSFLTVRPVDEQRVAVEWMNPPEGQRIGRTLVAFSMRERVYIGGSGTDTLRGTFVPGTRYPLHLRQWLNDTVDVDTTFLATKLNAPDNVQVQVTDSGLGLSWQDRSNYETRYMLKARAFSWDGDTLEGAKRLTGANGTSGFVSWGDPFWDFIPAGTALQKIVVGVYAARDTQIVVNGDTVDTTFFSVVVWAETLRPAPPALVSATVVANSGIRPSTDLESSDDQSYAELVC